MRIPEIQESDRGVGPRRLVDPAEQPRPAKIPLQGFADPSVGLACSNRRRAGDP